MEESGIPIEHRPEMWRLKNARPCRAEVRVKLTADCVASVQAWMAKPPDNVSIMDSSICNADRISILFHFKDADSFLQQNQHLSVFVADFTFETNQQSLVLGGIGPAGLRSGGSQKPGVRMLPTHFLLSRKEDKESQMTLFKAFAAAAHCNGIRLSHGFADCACMEGIQAVIESDPGLQHVQVHRCLHHTKQNVKQEVKRRNSETGEVRLRNMELLPVLLSFVMESAWFPSSLEFSSFWESVINRLRSNGEETDWDEPHVAQYLVRNLLQETGQAGLYSAPWRSGFGQVPAGFTTYTSNSLERSWRTIKGLLRKRTLLSDVGSLMKGVCDSFHSKLAAGDYENLKAAVADAPSCLHVRSQKQSVQVDSLDSEQEAQVVHRERLDLDALCKWFHKHGPTGTFVASVCNKPLDDGSTARLCYAFPKYCLQHALQKKPEMLAALQLGLSLTSEEVRHATASPLTGSYDVIRHLHLRSNFCTVWVTTDNRVVDGHRTYMSFAGHSEHSLFVHALLQPGGLAKIPGGPKSNLGKKRKKPLPKKSAHLKRMLRAPSSQNSNVVPAEILSEVRPDDACDLLPGSVTESSQRAVVEAAGQEKEVLCMSTTLRGDRCKRKRTHGCFCSHHFEISSTEKWSLQLYESVQEPASHAMDLWEERQLNLALQQSLQENQELMEKIAKSNAILDSRLHCLGLKRVPVAADGDCQFSAIVFSAQVPLTALQLRRSVVGYLRPLSACFGARMENQFRGRYGSYCSHMEQPGAWGDDLTLLASAHCLRRPLKIVTDSSATDPKQYIRIITPPQCISSACWGPEVTLCVSMDRHFDATENL
ncbi:unnamed protein product [Cladocopium goreaui]|uniref:OVARIAN TUMOR DOMAIN-containing deubiquitinating enzyme 5 (OTU domain-containing protein 5) (Deubiquitinating enzyme OTU5) n=1 Tax=Cladocopium goreaui TaxID=2562237 RepID=A0A9P1DFQ9_9DINO|nr:unnamed protein product [Cladocopium goreaui]